MSASEVADDLAPRLHDNTALEPCEAHAPR